MKKILNFGAMAFACGLYAQITVNITADKSMANEEVLLYGYQGSKDIILGREKLNAQGTALFKSKSQYKGMLKAYIPSKNMMISLISEGQPASLSISADNRVTYQDSANQQMNILQDKLRKKEMILPVLNQMAGIYEPSSDFGKAIQNEIAFLNQPDKDSEKYSFIQYYINAFSKYANRNPQKKETVDSQSYIDFINKSNEYLETSGLLRQILLNYINADGKNPEESVDKIMAVLQYETPRGQTILSEFIDIFDAYGLKDIKEKYLNKAQNLKCTINDRLANTIKANKLTQVGAIFPNYTFTQAKNTSVKTIHDVKADKKVIVFWSSGCSHCDTELPKILEKYSNLKQKNIEVIGLSVDVDKNSYEHKASLYPWINDAELRGWNGSYVKTYNIHGTPSYFVLDSKNKIIAHPDHVQDLLQFLGE